MTHYVVHLVRYNKSKRVELWAKDLTDMSARVENKYPSSEGWQVSMFWYSWPQPH